MSAGLIFSVVESPSHPRLSELYARLGFAEEQFSSMRKLLSRLKKSRPDYVVAEFFYGYGNNYAGVNISNLDVMLMSLKKFAPQARVVVFVSGPERQYVDQLNAIMPLHAVLTQPVEADAVACALTGQPAA